MCRGISAIKAIYWGTWHKAYSLRVDGDYDGYRPYNNLLIAFNSTRKFFKKMRVFDVECLCVYPFLCDSALNKFLTGWQIFMKLFMIHYLCTFQSCSPIIPLWRPCEDQIQPRAQQLIGGSCNFVCNTSFNLKRNQITTVIFTNYFIIVVLFGTPLSEYALIDTTRTAAENFD